MAPTDTESLRKLFRGIHSIHELATQLNGEAATLKEISVNAAIASGHVGSQSKVLSEIARQIGLVSDLVAQHIAKTHHHTGKMSSQALDCIVQSSRYSTFMKARNLMSRSPTLTLVREVCEQITASIIRQLDEAQEQLDCLKPEIENLKQLMNRVWSIVLSLHVSAGMAENGEDAFLNSIAEALEKVTQTTNEQLESLSGIVCGTQDTMTQQRQSAKEVNDVT